MRSFGILSEREHLRRGLLLFSVCTGVGRSAWVAVYFRANGGDLSPSGDLSHGDLSHGDLSHVDLSHGDLSHGDLSHGGDLNQSGDLSQSFDPSQSCLLSQGFAGTGAGSEEGLRGRCGAAGPRRDPQIQSAGVEVRLE